MTQDPCPFGGLARQPLSSRKTSALGKRPVSVLLPERSAFGGGARKARGSLLTGGSIGEVDMRSGRLSNLPR